MLYEAIAGKPAFTAASQASLIAAILKEEPPALSTLQPVVPPPLDRVVRKCLAKDPEGRWQSAADLRDELLWIAQSGAAPPLAAAPPRRRPLRWIPAAVTLAIGLAAGLGWQSFRAAPPVDWVGTRLAPTAGAHCPAISPDGQLVAFLTLVDDLAQVAVMKADGSSWTLLTTQKGAGYASSVAWAPDGSKIYYSRYFDQPRGVYSIPALGGDSTLLLENAYGGIPFPDGSLLVAKLVSSGQVQIFRYYPESGRSEALPAFLRNVDRPTMIILPGGREIAFYGFSGASPQSATSEGLYVFDMETRRARAAGNLLIPWNGFSRPLGAMPDGRSLVTVEPAEDTLQIVKVPITGAARPEVLFSLPRHEGVTRLDVGRDGSVYLDTWPRPLYLLHFPEAGGDPRQTPVPYDLGSVGGGPLSDGRFLFPASVGGKSRLLANTAAGDWRPFAQTSEETAGPASLSADKVAFLIGPSSRNVAIASVHDGRILQRVNIGAADPTGLALSADNQTLYYAAGGAIWSRPLGGSANSKKVADGNQVTVDPAGRFLYVEQLAKDPSALVRVALPEGTVQPIALPPDMRLTADPFSSHSVDSRGRLLFEVSSADSFLFSAALYDPARASVVRIPLRFEGDVWGPGWMPDGGVSAIGAGVANAIWHFHAVRR